MRTYTTQVMIKNLEKDLDEAEEKIESVNLTRRKMESSN